MHIEAIKKVLAWVVVKYLVIQLLPKNFELKNNNIVYVAMWC